VLQGWWTGAPLKPAGLAVCLAFGIFYTPMALLACALHDSVLAANPLTVLAAIARTPLRYLATCGLIGLLAGGGLLLDWLVPYVPLLTPLVGWGIAMYASLAVMHALGSMYYLSRERIGWFRLGLDEPLEAAAKS
jgi:hypothetical protein